MEIILIILITLKTSNKRPYLLFFLTKYFKCRRIQLFTGLEYLEIADCPNMNLLDLSNMKNLKDIYKDGNVRKQLIYVVVLI